MADKQTTKMDTVKQYLSGLKTAYIANGASEVWQHFEAIKHGTAKDELEALKVIYPNVPGDLISLLTYVDGTYWRTYQGEKIGLYVLGSDIDEYPYYLLSAKEMIDNQHIASQYYSDYIERKYEDVTIDERITNQTGSLKWLHFSDCMNNGGTSQLFIDFSPSHSGKIGQVVRFLHDPDELSVIADSFEEYLKLLIENKFDFINEDVI